MSMSNISLARTSAQREAIYRFRYDIFRKKNGVSHIPPDEKNRMIFDEADNESDLYFYRENNKVLSTFRSIPGCEKNFLKKHIDFFSIHEFEKYFKRSELAIVDSLFSDGDQEENNFEFQIFLSCYSELLNKGAKLCFSACDEAMLPKYLQYGFRGYGLPRLSENNLILYRLIFFLTDYEYLKKIGSPLLPYLPKKSDDKGKNARIVTGQLEYRLKNTSGVNQHKKAAA